MAICDNCQLPIINEVDNQGELCNPCIWLSNNDSPVKVKPLERDDLELVLAWRSNPEIYRHFQEQDGPIEWDDHVTWFESRPSDRYDFVIRYNGRRVGVINIDQDDQVGIYIGDISAQGKGIATNVLKWLCDRFAGRAPLTAEIHEENEPSKRLFKRCGFRKQEGNNVWIKYVYEP